MNAKELKTILNENRNVFIKMNEWIFVRKLDSAAGKEIHVFNNYRPEKSEFFIDVNEGVKFFMSKISYQKSFLKRKNIPLYNLQLEINLD